jgi:predicted N-acetyltransferase YhbS
MAEKKISVRPATAMDSVNIVRLLKAQYDEAAVRDLAPFDEDEILRYVTRTITPDPNNPFRAYLLVAEKDGRILASLALTPIPLPWNKAFIVLMESWFAVVPQYRTKGLADKLRDEAEVMLDTIGMFAFFGTNLLTTSAVDHVFANRDGYTAGRTAYVRTPKKKAAAA